MNLLYLLITAMTVSIDSFVCGLSLSMKSNKKFKIIFGISFVVLILCLIANKLGVLLADIFSKSELVGGIILILVAICDFLPKFKNNTETENTLKSALFIGFAIGLDGACACLSLSISGQDGLYVPLLFTAFHLIFIFLSIILTKNKLLKKIGENKYVSPVILILLGTYKIISSFL